MSDDKKHGNLGNSYASKAEGERLSGDRFYLTAPKGLKARCVKAAAAKGMKLNEWCREALEVALRDG